MFRLHQDCTNVCEQRDGRFMGWHDKTNEIQHLPKTSFGIGMHVRIHMWGQGVRSSLSPLKNHKSNTGQDPLEKSQSYLHVASI